MNVYDVQFYSRVHFQPIFIVVGAENKRGAALKAKNRLMRKLELAPEQRPLLIWVATEMISEQMRLPPPISEVPVDEAAAKSA